MLEIYKKVLTDFGSQCQAQALSGKKIAFTVFQLGDGEYTGEETVETLMKMTALKSQKQEFGISKMELSEGSDTIILTLIAINSEVNIGYNIREIGIFAKDANGTQGLYSICVAKKDKPDWMPAYNGIDPVTLVYRDYLRVGNAENISVDLNSGGLATEKMLEETATELRNEIETLEFDDYTEEGAEAPGARDAISAMVSGIKRPKMLAKIKAALMGLVTLGEMRALLVNNGLCTEPGKFFMDAAFGKMLQDQINEVNSNLSNYYALQGGIAIPSGANLKSDTYRIPGNYYCPTNDIASTLINSPVKDAFILKVEKATGDSYPKQVFKEYNTGKIVSRVYSSSQGIWFDEISYVTNSDFQNKNFGPITGDEILSYADSVLAKSSIELIYITVQEVAGLIGFSGYCGGFISHRNDTVFIMFLSYSDNSIITNSRSRASDWKGWMKFKGVAI